MTKVQMKINDMHNGNIDAIMNGISSPVPIVVLNAILAGTQRNLHNAAFVDGVKKASQNNETILGIPIKAFAAASLHLLDEEKYSGKDTVILTMINSKLKM